MTRNLTLLVLSTTIGTLLLSSIYLTYNNNPNNQPIFSNPFWSTDPQHPPANGLGSEHETVEQPSILVDSSSIDLLGAGRKPLHPGFIHGNNKLNILNSTTPTSEFRSNIREESLLFTITNWAPWGAGFSNQLIVTMDLIVLAIRMERTPVLPPFMPTHLPESEIAMDFGEIFDLDILAAGIGADVIEWKDIAVHPTSENPYPMSDETPMVCLEPQGWDQRREVIGLAGPNRLDVYNLNYYMWIAAVNKDDVMRWDSIIRYLNYEIPQNLDIYLASHPEEAATARLPDPQILCMGWLFWSGGAGGGEMNEEFWPAFNSVGKHMRWSKKLMDMSDGLLSEIFGGQKGEPVQYISVHIRHGDFVDKYCSKEQILEERCFEPISTQVKAVELMQAKILERTGTLVSNVLVATDEEEPIFLKSVTDLGWKVVDPIALRIEELHGPWYPPLMDSVLLSRGQAVVGTVDSTYSIIAAHRVSAWVGGPSVMVKSVG